MTAMTLGAISQAIRCTFPFCKCECFSSSKTQIRTCQNCKHGWVTHALDKLLAGSLYPNMSSSQTEPISPSLVFDIASLVLYDCQAIPIRIKFCLDRLFSALQHDEVLQILHGFGWSYEDYARGYILQDPTGRVQEKWSIVLREEETIILQQFLRFSETRNIAQELILQENKALNANEAVSPTQTGNVKSESDIRKFIERNNMALIQSYNLALRRAFDNPQSLFSTMGTFPSHMNMAAAAAAASQLGRPFQPQNGMFNMPTAGFPQMVASKPEPITTTEQSNRKAPEPYDLSSKRSPESQKSASPTTSVPLGFNSTSPMTPTMDGRRFPDINSSGGNAKKETSPLPNLVRRPTSPPSSNSNNNNKGWPFNNPSFGQTVFVTSSGKKRVLCTACNKTFCDKGALKIHYSAVHLKEMHQCTIPGCNMMFSSRRSRNRHSANPNPKLHTPQTRRPRERYDTAQDQMLAMMGMRQGPKSTDGGSVDEDDTDGDKSKEYLAGADKSRNGSEDGQLDLEDFGDDDIDDELPTQVKLRQDCPLYGSSKRKRLMPTRVTTAAEPTSMTVDDTKSENDKSVMSDSPSLDDSLDVGDSSDPINQNMYIREESEPGEMKNGSPVEPGEVIRHGDEKHFLSGFPPKMASPDKQASAMQTLFSSLLPTNGEQTPTDFWSNFIKQTAAAKQMAQRLAEQQEGGDKSLNSESYNSKPAELSDSKRSANPSDKSTEDNSKSSSSKVDCDLCDKSFLSLEALTRHKETVHRDKNPMYPQDTATYPNYIDSLKNKTQLVA